MPTRSKFARLLEHRYARRAITLPLTALLAVAGVLLAPITILVAAILDRGRPWQRVRLVVLITGGLFIELLGVLGSLLTWILTGFGLFRNQEWTWRMHRPLMAVYTSTLIWFIARVMGTRVEWRSRDQQLDGPVLLLARHTSFFDALIPATVLARDHRRVPHHVLTAGLRYMPCIDLVGHRFPNRFIRRTPGDGSAELGEIRRLAGLVHDRSAALIFPEGTFRNPQRFERAIRRLRRRHAELADRAETFNHVLPPRPQGSFALTQGAPEADILVCVNTGLEPFGTLDEIKTSLVAERPIIVETWTIPAADVPDTPDEFNLWLMDVYADIDQWVSDQLAAPSS